MNISKTSTTDPEPEKDWDDFFIDSETGLVIELADYEGFIDEE